MFFILTYVVSSLTAGCLTEVERFIEMNTEKINENKYLCPLSGKKFKGPEFVKKHIFNKHMEKVDAVKQEVSELCKINPITPKKFSKLKF